VALTDSWGQFVAPVFVRPSRRSFLVLSHQLMAKLCGEETAHEAAATSFVCAVLAATTSP